MKNIKNCVIFFVLFYFLKKYPPRLAGGYLSLILHGAPVSNDKVPVYVTTYLLS